MTDIREQTIADVVAADYRAASVFEKYGIDFCCGGARGVAQACEARGISIDDVARDISAATHTRDGSVPRFTEWELDFLADYIVTNHHAYVLNAIPNILAHVNKVAAVHGANHRETVAVRDIFTKTANDLLQHMQKEEQILFPFIRALAAGKREGSKGISVPFGSVQFPITMMMEEHDTAAEEFEQIHKLTNDFQLPDDACTTYRITYQEIAEFEQDLHRHIFLENNILFPGAIALEGVLNK